MSEFNELTWFKDAVKSLLKPCPFCGEKSDIAIHVPNRDGNEDVTCLKCGAKMTKALGIGVVKAWNQRTTNPQQ